VSSNIADTPACLNIFWKGRYRTAEPLDSATAQPLGEMEILLRRRIVFTILHKNLNIQHRQLVQNLDKHAR
jgi:hypothetical protein